MGNFSKGVLPIRLLEITKISKISIIIVFIIQPTSLVMQAMAKGSGKPSEP